MVPDRIIFIRHAEEQGAPGVIETGETDAHSLTVRGWQRAGALARRLILLNGGSDLTPDAVFASRVGKGSETRRPQQTLSPLVALRPGIFHDTSHLKTDVDELMSDVLSRRGTLLVAWEQSMITACVARPEAPRVPTEWPLARYGPLLDPRSDERKLVLHATPAAPAGGRWLRLHHHADLV